MLFISAFISLQIYGFFWRKYACISAFLASLSELQQAQPCLQWLILRAKDGNSRLCDRFKNGKKRAIAPHIA
jgi:hypothetical protein